MLINQFFFVLHSMNRQGECYRHAMTCGAGIGIFLMLRVCFLPNVMIYVFSCMNLSKQGMCSLFEVLSSERCLWVLTSRSIFAIFLCNIHQPSAYSLYGQQSDMERLLWSGHLNNMVHWFYQRTNILLQRCERQAMWPSLYLDAFGEEVTETLLYSLLFHALSLVDMDWQPENAFTCLETEAVSHVLK